MNRLDGKVAFLSGAARGIGGETARLMSKAGARVAIGDVLDEVGRKLAREIDGFYVHLDVTDEASWAAAMEATVKKYYREADGRIRLQPANPSMEPIYLPEDGLQIRGVVVGLMRHYR